MALGEILGNWKFQMKVPEKTRFRELLVELKKVYGKKLEAYLFEPDGKTPASHMMFLINGRSINFLDGPDTLLNNEDLVTILLPAGGG